MTHCVNKNLSEFKSLAREASVSESALAAKVSLWQDKHGLDKWPTVNQLIDNNELIDHTIIGQPISLQQAKDEIRRLIPNIKDENIVVLDKVTEAAYRARGIYGKYSDGWWFSFSVPPFLL